MVEGSVCTFECQKGLVLTGFMTLTCTSTGTWNNPQPFCQRYCAEAQVHYV